MVPSVLKKKEAKTQRAKLYGKKNPSLNEGEKKLHKEKKSGSNSGNPGRTILRSTKFTE